MLYNSSLIEGEGKIKFRLFFKYIKKIDKLQYYLVQYDEMGRVPLQSTGCELVGRDLVLKRRHFRLNLEYSCFS